MWYSNTACTWPLRSQVITSISLSIPLFVSQLYPATAACSATDTRCKHIIYCDTYKYGSNNTQFIIAK